MTKNRMVRRLLGGGLATIGMLAMAIPAHAGTTTPSPVTDPSGDTQDPFLTQGDPLPVHTPDPSADITSYSLTSNATARTLTATITVAGHIPDEGSTSPTAYEGPIATGVLSTGQEYPAFAGGSYLAVYADTRTEANTYTLTPACTNAATGAPIRDYQEHYKDGYRHFIGVSVEFDGTAWSYSPQIGSYDPTASGGWGFYDLKSEPNMAGKFSYSHAPGSNTITVTVNTDVSVSDTTCVGGVAHFDYGKAGDTITGVTGFTTTDQVVVLPVTVPLSAIPEADQSDLKAIGGLVYTEDWAVDANYSLGTAGPGSAVGPTCPTPTFGGKLPTNPLFQDGQPCNVNNPEGGGFRQNTSANSQFVY